MGHCRGGGVIGVTFHLKLYLRVLGHICEIRSSHAWPKRSKLDQRFLGAFFFLYFESSIPATLRLDRFC